MYGYNAVPHVAIPIYTVLCDEKDEHGKYYVVLYFVPQVIFSFASTHFFLHVILISLEDRFN